MNKYNLLLILLIPFLLGADFVCHDKSVSPTSGRIVQRAKSVGAAFSSRPECVKITRQEYDSLTRWGKVVNSQLVLMSQGEIDAILQMETDAQEQALLDAIDRYDISNIDLITALIKIINVRIPSNPITKQEFINQIKSDLGL